MIPQGESFATEELWKFNTEDLGQEGYLMYQASDQYLFHSLCSCEMQGPMLKPVRWKVLEHLARMDKGDHQSYPGLYKESLTEKQEAAHT